MTAAQTTLALYDTRRCRPLTAYLLWFFLGGFGVHLVYSRRWAFLVFHYVIMALLFWIALGPLEAPVNAYLVWATTLLLEGCILYHQVNDTNRLMADKIRESFL